MILVMRIQMKSHETEKQFIVKHSLYQISLKFRRK